MPLWSARRGSAGAARRDRAA